MRPETTTVDAANAANAAAVLPTLVREGAFEAALPVEALDLDNDADTAELDLAGVGTIRVAFPSFADGRGLSLARRLRDAGFTGTLRASGHVIAEQYPMALRCGFDEVEIAPALAARQPERLWREAMERVEGNYQDRLKREGRTRRSGDLKRGGDLPHVGDTQAFVTAKAA